MDFLIISDDLVLQDQMIQTILHLDPSHNVDTAHSSYEAQQKFRKTKYDAVIVEVYLTGGIMGNELIHEIHYPCFKVGMADYLENPQIRMSFNEFLIKPVQDSMISDIIKKAQYNLEFALKLA